MDEIFTVLAGVLHIGNIEFTGDDKVTIKDMDQVKLVCEILKLNEKSLVTSLTYVFILHRLGHEVWHGERNAFLISLSLLFSAHIVPHLFLVLGLPFILLCIPLSVCVSYLFSVYLVPFPAPRFL